MPPKTSVSPRAESYAMAWAARGAGPLTKRWAQLMGWAAAVPTLT